MGLLVSQKSLLFSKLIIEVLYLLRRSPVDEYPAFATSSTRMAGGRVLFWYLCSPFETPVGHLRRGRRIRRIAWGIRSPDADTHASTPPTSANILTSTFVRLMIFIVRNIIGKKEKEKGGTTQEQRGRKSHVVFSLEGTRRT